MSNTDHFDITQAYLKDLRKLPRLNQEKTAALLRRLESLKKGDEEWLEVRNQLIEGNLGLAVFVAKKYRHPKMDLLDAVQVCSTALMKVVDDGWKTSNSCGTAAYARKSMTNALSQEAAKTTRPVTLDASDIWGAASGSKRISPARLISLRNASRPMVELSAPVNDDDDVATGESVSDTIADPMYPAPDAGLDKRDLRKAVQTVIDMATPPLNEIELTVLRLRFGLSDGIEHTIEEIAYTLNLSLVRTQSANTTALKKLKRGVAVTDGPPPAAKQPPTVVSKVTCDVNVTDEIKTFTAPEIENIQRRAFHQIRMGQMGSIH